MEVRTDDFQEATTESQDEFERQYDARKLAELQARRKYREELLTHRDNIRLCNRMLILEGIVLVSLIVALILQFV